MNPHEILEQLDSLKVLVLGDGILDKYTFGSISRISREAPIPVFEVQTYEERLGGACNTALNAKQLANNIKIVTVLGEDESGDRLLNLLNSKGIDTSLCLRSKQVKTTLKERFVSKKQQVFRVDVEQLWKLQNQEQIELEEKIKEGILWSDCILASDHATSFFSAKIFSYLDELSKSGYININSRPLFLDTRSGNFKFIKSCSAFKVNQVDASSILGEEVQSRSQLDRLAEMVKQNLSTEIVIVTLGERGCYINYENSGRIYDAQVVEISDVSGAGDTFLVVFSLIFTVLKQVDVAATLANRAGARVVQRFGTSYITKEELLQDIKSVLI